MARKSKESSKKRTAKKRGAKSGQKRKARKASQKKAKNLIRRVARSASAAPDQAAPMAKGRGARTAGQSGDVEGLSDAESVDSESVEELAEEGQDYEAELVDAVENAPEPDEAELDAEIPEDEQDPDARSFSKRNRL